MLGFCGLVWGRMYLGYFLTVNGQDFFGKPNSSELNDDRMLAMFRSKFLLNSTSAEMRYAILINVTVYGQSVRFASHQLKFRTMITVKVNGKDIC